MLARPARGRTSRGAGSPNAGSALPHGITFDERGFDFRGDDNGVLIWTTPHGDELALHHYPIPPDIRADLDNIDDIRAWYRRDVIRAGLGVIEIETRVIDGCRAVRTIFKAAQGPTPRSTGRTYVAALTFPFRDVSYVLKAQCEERGTTGERDTFVLAKLMESGEISIAGVQSGPIPNWLDDPYDPSAAGPMTRNKSERPEYDDEFPDHPLTRARALLSHLERTVAIANGIKQQPSA